ncbi:MAG TPA: hypothetical protein VE981_05630 [Planctomycetota bacterium]|nr:hypothetical protein [Planctomycetota bacterium]
MVRVLAILLLCAAPAADDATTKALQGRWTGARYTEGNGENQSGAQKLDFVFKDNTLLCAKESGALVGQATFTVSSDGKLIDCTGTSSGYQNKSYPGILKIEGDKLWWCTSGAAGKNAKRPGSFVANAGEASYLIVLTRVKS